MIPGAQPGTDRPRRELVEPAVQKQSRKQPRIPGNLQMHEADSQRPATQDQQPNPAQPTSRKGECPHFPRLAFGFDDDFEGFAGQRGEAEAFLGFGQGEPVGDHRCHVEASGGQQR